MTTRVWLMLAGWLLLGILVAGGCSRGPTYAEVEGTVKMNGRPLHNVKVQFLPDPAAGTFGKNSSGITDKNGRYELVTEDQRPGAVVGAHRVLIVDLAPYENLPPGRLPDDYKLKPPRVPARYYDSDRTPLRVEVKEGGRQTINLDVSSSP